MTVAVALLAVQAMAMAPVIGEIPSPIVGNTDAVTGVTGFIYVDALNLPSYVSDDSTPAANILWSYEVLGTASHYTLNGVPAIDTTTENPVTPPAGKVINTQVLNGEFNLDTNFQTVTIRNTTLTPFSGSGTPPGGTGILSSEIQPVTLYASDGSTIGIPRVVYFYSDAGGLDRLSGQGNFVTDVNENFSSAATRSTYSFVNWGGITTSTNGGTAICLNSPLVGNNAGFWYSDYGKIVLVKNAVYRIRMNVNSSNVTAGSTPFWDVVVDNVSADLTKGFNAYGADFMFFDNLGGADSAIQTPGGKKFEMWFTPPAVKTARWNDSSVASGAGSSLFSSGNVANKDGRITFRVLDVNSNGGITADQKSGSLCLMQLVIDRYDLSTLVIDADAGNYSAASLANTTHVIDNFGGATAVFSSGTVVVTPTSGNMYIRVSPGNGVIDTPTERLDNWPVPWADQTLYQVTVGMSAANSTPPGAYWVGSDTASQELLGEGFCTNQGWGAGEPQPGTAQDFVFYMHGNYQGTGGSPADASYVRLRPKVVIGDTPQLHGTGAVTISSMKMEKCHF